MAEILRMPSVLAGVTEATIAAWVAQEGSTITSGTILAEIETEKALVDLPAERGGVLVRILAAAGETVAVGAPIAIVLESHDDDADLDALVAEAGTPAARGGVTGGAGAAPEAVEPGEYSGARPTRTPEPVTDGPATVPAASSPPADAHAGRIFASPLVRRLARERSIDVGRLSGSGPGGRIVRRDLEAHLATDAEAAGTQAPSATPPPVTRDGASPAGQVSGAAGTATGHTAMRRAIARRLTESKTTVPHFYLRANCRVDDLLALRQEINAASKRKISLNDLVVKAVAVAYRAVPEANVVWTEDALVHLDRVDVAVAVSTPGGLVTPVVRSVEQSSVSQLSATIADLAGRAREGRLRQHELEGGSFSVSNLGMHQIEEFSAIINPPHSGILAVGAARQQAVVDDGVLTVGTTMTVVLSADHRALDGELAARWLRAFVAAVEHPLTLLI